MNPTAADLRLESRARLIADICEELRAGQDPRPGVAWRLESLKRDPEERDFVLGVLGVLRPERELQWA